MPTDASRFRALGPISTANAPRPRPSACTTGGDGSASNERAENANQTGGFAAGGVATGGFATGGLAVAAESDLRSGFVSWAAT